MRSRRVIFDLLAILVVGVALLAMVRAFRVPPGTGASSTAGARGRPGAVDPEPYRYLLDRLEINVYADSADIMTGGRIAAAAQDLADAIITREPRMMGTHAHQELFVFAMSIGAEEFPSTPPDADSVRRAWEAVRGAVFKETYWFRTLSAER